MDIDEILIDDDLDIEILEVKSKEDSASISSVRQPITKKGTPPSNPVQEHLVKQLNCVQNQIDQAKSNIEIVDNVTEKILANLSKQAAYRDEASSESDNDLFSSTGEPIVRRKKKKKKNKVHEKHKVIAVKDVWQRVVDDKWVIGVVIECSTTCILKEPALYMCPKGRENNCHGVCAFWTLAAGLWYPIEEIEQDEESVATVVLDLPIFDEENPYYEAHGTIFCEFDDKSFQTPVPAIKLEAINVVDASCALEFEENAKYSILALKALSIDKIVLLPVNPESNMGKRLMKFLETYDFQEICKVCIVRDIGSLQYCILEVMPADDDGDLKILLSARSEAQLSTMIQLMREDFPELLDVEKQQALEEAAEALREELELYLTCDDAAKLQRARVKSDLLMP